MNIMDRLAAARPDWLDPSEPDFDRRYRDLESALSQSAEHVRSCPRVRRFWAYGLVGLAAAGTAAAVAVATTSGGGAVRHQEAKGPGSGRSPGRNIVLAAAEKAEQQPLGAYWYTDQVEAQAYVVRARTGTYAIAGAASEFFEWTAARQGGGNLFYGRDLAARPLTPADEAAWRRAGSPTSFRVWSNDHYDTFTRTTGHWSADYPAAQKGGHFMFTGFPKEKCADGTITCANPEMAGATLDDIMSLPTDPAALRPRYLAAADRDGSRAKGRGNPVPVDVLFEVESDLHAPVPPKLRAGLIRMLATIPGVRQIPSVTDAQGRQGFAFAAVRPAKPYDASSRNGGFTSLFELIFAADGTYLGDQDVLLTPGGEYKDQKPGFVINYWLVRSSGWTNTKPAPPK